MKSMVLLALLALPTAGDGPAGWWKLDDAKGSSSADASGTNNQATLSGETSWTDGLAGKGALRLNGGSVRISRTAKLESQAVTLAAWIKREGDQVTWANVVRKTWKNNGGPTWTTWSLQLNPNGTGSDVVCFETGYSGSNHILESKRGAIPDGTWVHVAGVYDPASPAPQKKLYLNGILHAAVPQTAALSYDTTETGDIYFGQNGGGGEIYKGAVGDIRVYSRALTADEIRPLAAGAPPPPTPKEARKAAEYKPSSFAIAYTAPAKAAPAAAEIQTKVSFQVSAGPLEAALESVERQTGLAFAVV